MPDLERDGQATRNEDAGGGKGRGKKDKAAKSDKKRLKSPNTSDASYTAPLKDSSDSLDSGAKADLSIGRSSGELSLKSDTAKSDLDNRTDCSTLTGYLETAILESACNTLERLDKAGMKKPADCDEKTTVPCDVTDEQENVVLQQASSSFDGGLYVEYVSYDFNATDDASGSSGRYDTSDEEDRPNSNNNSNHEGIDTVDGSALQADASRVYACGQDQPHTDVIGAELGVSNNSAPRSYEEKYKSGVEFNEKRTLADQADRGGTTRPDNDTEYANASCDTHPQREASAKAQIGSDSISADVNNLRIIDQQNSACRDGNTDLKYTGNTRDMEKAKSLFGMCLCQNGEQVDHVTDLDFRNCNLKQVPQEIFQFAQSLTHLQLDSNTLSDLPKSLFSCSSLEYLTASDNDLGALPASLAGLSNLKYLDISKNVVEDIPDCIKCCKSLSVLDASVNPIERLSDGFTQLVGLSELYLNDCFLEFLPANFGRLVQLNVLELRDNQLQILPKSIRRLCLLKRLDLGGNVFQEWPDVVCELRRLTELWLDGNELGKVPEQVGELSALVYLDLSRNFIESIPGQIGSLRQLTDLLLCENHITYLPDSIGFLDKLTMLKASMNQLVRIPESIGKLKEVEELDLSHNKLEEIPPTIGNLTMMHTLLLDNNALSYVPAEIGGCERLNVLQLSRNRLDEIPKEVGELSELRVFNICRNRLPYLPITVIKLAQLEALWVSSNQSKPNVPLHAELAGDGKTRILTNVLFPQTEQGTLKSRAKTDSDGYANDAADDDEPPLFRKQRGVTRVAFNLRPVCYNSSDDDYSDEDKIRENGVMVIDIPAKDHNSNEKFPVSDQGNSVDVSDAVMSNNGLHLQPLTLSVRSPDKSDDSIDGPESAVVSPTNGLLSDELRPPSYHAINAEDQSDERAAASPKTQVEETESEPKSVSVPDLRKSPEKPEEDTILSNPEIESPADSEYEDSPRIKTWSSHSHLPAIPNSSGDLKPVAAEIISDQSSVSSSNGAENVTKVTRLPIPSQAIFNKGPADSIGEIKIDNSPKPPRKDPLEDIPFVDSEISDESDASALVLKAQLGKSPKKPKPPPPPRKDSLLNKTKFAQNETGGASKLPTVSPKTTASTSATVSTPATPSGLKIFTPALLNRQKSLSYDSEDLPLPPLDDRPPLDGLPPTDRDSGVGNDVDSQESIPECEEGATKATAPAVPPKPSKIAASIKMFESISVDPKSPNAGSKTLADLLPTGPRRIDDKAIIKPNNHLDDSVLEKAPEPPVKPQIPREIMSETREVVFSRRNDDITDAAAFSKALNEISTAPDRRKITRSRSDSGESAKQTQFRERLEKIMQQQKSVSAASKAAQGGAALSLSRKASFNSMSQPTSPDGSGLEKLTADSAFPVPEHFQTPSTHEFKSPVKKSVSDKLKNKLDRGSNGAPVKSPSSSRIARSRPGSAPAAQLLQRRNSNPRNSLSAAENDDKRSLGPFYGGEEHAGTVGRTRSKSIEQQLGQLLLDSDEERLLRDQRVNYERRTDDQRREQHRLKHDSSGIRGSRNSLCSPPPVRHNMYAKARSSTNTASAPLADWKHKLLQHIERKRIEKEQVAAMQNMARSPRVQQPQKSIGKIKSPPRTSGPGSKQGYYEQYAVSTHRGMGQKSVTAPVLQSAPKMVTNTHAYRPDGPAVRSHFSGNSRAARLAKQRTFTPGPEAHGNQPAMAPRPKSAMDNLSPQHHHVEPTYAEPPTYRQPVKYYADLRTRKQPPLPTYEDYLHRREVPARPQEPQRLSRSESTRKSYRGGQQQQQNARGRRDYEDVAGYPLRQTGSHESLMDAARYNQQHQHDAYFPSTPLRNASSHDSVLDQAPYQPASYAPQQYPSPAHQTRYPNNHAAQRYQPAETKRGTYASPDYATYVSVYDYEQPQAEYHSQAYHPRAGYRNSARGQRQTQHPEQDMGYGNYAYPPGYHNARQQVQAQAYEQRYRHHEPVSPVLYRPLPEREEESVASAFRPYHQQQPQHKPHHRNPYAHAQSYGLPPNHGMMQNEYKHPGRHMSPPSNYQYMPEQRRHAPRQPPQAWSDTQEDFERVTVSVRRNPTFGFHVTGGMGFGGNSYRPADEGVFVTHVTLGGAADNKLQPGDKILMVNGSDFVGISHQRAVDLLRNAGKVAVIVVERSLGKPV